MTLIIATTKTVAGYGYLIGAFDSIFVDPGVTVTSTDGVGIYNTGSNQVISIAGKVRGHTAGIVLGGDDNDVGNRLFVDKGASVTSKTTEAVRVQGSGATIDNEGSIVGVQSGINFEGNGLAKTTLDNSGLIMGTKAIRFGSGKTAAVDIFNSDEIISVGSGIGVDGIDYGGAIRLFNAGFILGDVHLSEVNDFYDGRGGTIEGDVFGRAGNDVFIPGEKAEKIYGGEGTADLLDFRSSATIKVALDQSAANTGNALGDFYFNIERVYGSGTGNDTIIGDAANNLLSSIGGIDTLNGKAGHDTLIGGEAKDKLTGDVGNDSFRFDKLTECGDSILDFSSNAAGNNDQIQIKASAFGGGLVAGALDPTQFITRTDNVAQDANDRFIFRTSDKSLWFDANGNAAGGGLTLVADLQAAATMTNLDIVLI